MVSRDAIKARWLPVRPAPSTVSGGLLLRRADYGFRVRRSPEISQDADGQMCRRNDTGEWTAPPCTNTHPHSAESFRKAEQRIPCFQKDNRYYSIPRQCFVSQFSLACDVCRQFVPCKIYWWYDACLLRCGAAHYRRYTAPFSGRSTGDRPTRVVSRTTRSHAPVPRARTPDARARTPCNRHVPIGIYWTTFKCRQLSVDAPCTAPSRRSGCLVKPIDCRLLMLTSNQPLRQLVILYDVPLVLKCSSYTEASTHNVPS